MTVGEAIARIDQYKPNAVDPMDKKRWLLELDNRLRITVINHYSNNEQGNESDPESVSSDHKLIIAPPFDTIYIYWLESMIDYQNGEVDQYNNSSAMFRDALEEWKHWYSRTHQMPQRHITYF